MIASHHCLSGADSSKCPSSFSSQNMDPHLIPKPWVLPPLSNSWIINIIWLCIALNRTPNIDCYWVGAVPNIQLRLVNVELRGRDGQIQCGNFRRAVLQHATLIRMLGTQTGPAELWCLKSQVLEM